MLLLLLLFCSSKSRSIEYAYSVLVAFFCKHLLDGVVERVLFAYLFIFCTKIAKRVRLWVRLGEKKLDEITVETKAAIFWQKLSAAYFF